MRRARYRPDGDALLNSREAKALRKELTGVMGQHTYGEEGLSRLVRLPL